jgi:flagellar biosynthesis/type III secretory pathway protein FliH
MSYYIAKTVGGGFDETIERVKAALSDEGFGVLTEIDVKRLPSYAIGFEAGAAEGRAEGKAEGQAEQKTAIIRQLLLRLDPAQVAELLGLSADEVQGIADQQETRQPPPDDA